MEAKTLINSKEPTKVEKKKVHQDEKYTEEEKKCIFDLKKLYLETIQHDVDLQRDIYNLEKSYEAKHNEIYDKRYKLLEDFKKQTQGGDAGEQGNVVNFWLKVLKASYTEFISKRDEKILVYLKDIRAKLYNEPVVKFVLEFYFDPNDYFSNDVLTKAYFLNCFPDPKDPLSYDGAEIYKCEGCKIDWKHSELQENDKKEKLITPFTSFFDFFNPPILPEDSDDVNYSEINAILQNDFELGFYLKERVIPKAVMFFTGEIADCQTSESECDDEDAEEEEDDSSVNSVTPDKTITTA